MTSDVLHKLSTASLKSLAASFRTGALTLEFSPLTIGQLAGCEDGNIVEYFRYLQKTGLSPIGISLVLEAVVEARERAVDPDRILEIVLSGPDIQGVPCGDTAATVQSLLEEAQREILIVGYVVYQGKLIFERLSKKMRENPDLKVTMCIDIARRNQDTSLSSEIVSRFVADFKEHQWPWEPMPVIYYDPRSLSEEQKQRSSLHAKCLVIDGKAAFITSANFTEAAQARNIELGVVIRHPRIAQKIDDYFTHLQHTGFLRRYY